MLVALFLLSAALNVCGYLFSWFHTVGLYDEAVHMITTFTGIAALARSVIALRGSVADWPRPLPELAAVGVGMLLGLAWELFELRTNIIGDRLDTLIDLVMDATGAAAAASLVMSRRLFAPADGKAERGAPLASADPAGPRPIGDAT